MFDLTQRQKPAPVFLVSEDLRHQVRYWKDRRNDCAHFKANEIDHSHVESFWNFIFSNMGKFVPNGSAAALLNEIVLYFDEDFTPPNTPLDPIIERIPHCVERDGLTQFFIDIAEKVTRKLSENFATLRDVHIVFDAVIRVTNELTINALREVILNHFDYFVSFVREFPQHVILLKDNSELTRCLWRKYLFLTYHNKDFNVFAALLRAHMIHRDEIDEVSVTITIQLKGNIPNQMDVLILDQIGFFDTFQRTVFEGMQLNDFNWWNVNAKLVCWYLESYPIPVEAVRSICSIFTQSNYPWKVRNRLTELFKENSNKRQEFEEIAQQEQLALPENIFGE